MAENNQEAFQVNEQCDWMKELELWASENNDFELEEIRTNIEHLRTRGAVLKAKFASLLTTQVTDKYIEEFKKIAKQIDEDLESCDSFNSDINQMSDDQRNKQLLNEGKERVFEEHDTIVTDLNVEDELISSQNSAASCSSILTVRLE